MLYSKKLMKRLTTSLLVFIAIAIHVNGQWSTQTVTLHPGWNAVFLQVQPEPNDCSTLFADMPVEEVWAWNRRFTTVQFIKNPEELLPEQEDWLVYFPQGHPHAPSTNLFTLNGSRSYLIKLGGTEPKEWVITGQPHIRDIEWLEGSYNLVGFHLSPHESISFSNFFASSPTHSHLSVLRMDAAGDWNEVADADTEILNPGEAYWIYSQSPSSFSGPMTLEFEQGQRMDFGRVMMEQQLRIHNHTDQQKTVRLAPRSSAQPPSSSSIGIAGEVPLSYFAMDLANNIYEWRHFTEPLTITMEAGKTENVRIAVRRPDMDDYRLPDGIDDALYQSILEITDGEATFFQVPVTSEGLQPFSRASANGGIQKHIHAGLWVGSAVINAVSEPASSADEPTPTASEFNFRVIIHVDADGKANLLKQALLMHRPGAYKADHDNPALNVVDEPGQFVLLSKYDPELIAKLQLSGAAIRGNKLVGRRVSSAAFALDSPQPLDGHFGEIDETAALHGTILLDYNHPLNPFKHLYHPDHNNLDERFKKTLPAGDESYTIHRKLQLEFTEEDPMGLALAGWGDNQVGGTYKETITGVHKDAIHISGFFRLHKVSPVAALDAVEEIN